ncbi:GGDEF domain-containing protein [Uliginosibacterium sp. H3]|uniref:diguanylate cyclase n=1 Tax=Uliginosibacterium silvisoli TaxID=3114758 RepID=A0ABU6K2P7_9RHOO|nr:GGDEF domain-containing protein [Uliginosibacterium sp. H3]
MTRPRPGKQLRWLQDHRQSILDLGILAGAVGVLCMGVASLDLTGWLAALDARHPAWHVLPLVVLMGLSSPLVLVFAWRRWRELDDMMADADTDGLTGLHNRRKTERLLEREFDRALRYARPLSLVMFDVDHFKRINDSLGHPAGDLVLAGIARRIQRKMRATDHLGRWGGEEFLLICPETDTEGAMQIADRMRRAIRRKAFSSAGLVTASFGIGSHSGEGNVDVLVQRADQWLYAAKQRGRDCVVSHLNAGDDAGVFLQQDVGVSSIGPGTRLSNMLSTIAAPMRRARG